LTRPETVAAALRVLIILVVSVPLSFLLTIAMFPFWRWFEAATAIESFGHSGPSEWCYLATFLIVATSAVLAFSRRGGKP
jgi:hypothetical protein